MMTESWAVCSRLTSQYGGDDGRQDTPGVDGHVEDGEELPPLVCLRERGVTVSTTH